MLFLLFFWWSKISDFSIAAMVVELFGMPRTVYELEVLKYSEYSEGSEGHSELGKSASEGGLTIFENPNFGDKLAV